MKNILWLGEAPQRQTISLIGGKAGNLSRLAAHFPVPPGFCLTTQAYTQANRRYPGAVQLPGELYQQVATAYQQLATRSGTPNLSVAVRSSAVDEDGSGASFAGQHETYLNIVGANAVAEAVVRCWESARAERVLAYRQQQGLATHNIRIAVLVQQLVTADVSGVVFSANPVTGNPYEVMINASWGLGESIVGGTTTPDNYLVDKRNLTITARHIGAKERMTVGVAGGTREVAVPRFLRSQPALNDHQMIEMAQLAIDLEKTMGWPVDVECAWQKNQLYLLQCRPITTLRETVKYQL